MSGMQTRSGHWADADGTWTHQVRGKVVDVLVRYVPQPARSSQDQQLMDQLRQAPGQGLTFTGDMTDLPHLEALGHLMLRARDDAWRKGDRESAYYLALYGGRALIHAREASRGAGTPPRATSNRDAAPRRVEFLTAVHQQVEQPLLRAGWSRVTLHAHRSARIELHLPADHPLQPAARFTLRARDHAFRFRHIAHRLPSFEASHEVIAAVRQRYGRQLEEKVPPGTRLRWHVDTGRAQQNDQWQAEHPGGGYVDLEPFEGAEWAIAVASLWVELLDRDPPVGLI